MNVERSLRRLSDDATTGIVIEVDIVFNDFLNRIGNFK